MADPFRLRVMKALSNQLKTITPDNGYDHDLSDYTDAAGRDAERVFRGRDLFGDNDPKPMLCVLEDPRAGDPYDSTGNGKGQLNQFKVLVQGFVADDKNHPLDPAYRLSADVIKALAAAKRERYATLGFPQSQAPTVMGMSIGQPVHRPGSDEVSPTAYFLIAVTVTLAEVLDKPYA